jgi:hypothetical protein
MIIDHVGAALLPGIFELRVIGRIAFPLYCWCLAVGAVYTRNIARYGLRLLLTGVLSQPFYMAAFGHEWYELNIFFTLFLGLTAIAALRDRRFFVHIWGPALCVLLPCLVSVDYGWKGVLLIILLYSARKERSAIAAVMIAFCMSWGSGSATVTSFAGIPLVPPSGSIYAALLAPLDGFRKVQNLALMALPLMLIPVKIKVRFPKVAAYLVYPAHLAVIALIRWLL